MHIYELGSFVSDSASEIKGILTHFSMDGSGKIYLFQPAGLNPKTKAPLDSFWIDELRIVGGKWVDIDLPTYLIGTKAKDTATGFEGTIVTLTYHLNGCIHADIKPKGVIKETGEPIAAQNFDIRRLKGDKIKPLTNKEKVESHKKTPSPAPCSPRRKL